MTDKLITDAAGKTLQVAEINGRHYPRFGVDGLKHCMEMKARSDDIVIITYPKSGTHWTFEIIRFLMAGTIDLPYVEKDNFMIEDCEPSYMDKLPSPRNLNSHYHANVISQDFFKQKSRMIFVTRDPRDTAVSYFNHHKKLVGYYDYKGEWSDYLPMFLEGKLDYDSWFEYTKDWEKAVTEHPENPILVLAYETMKMEPFKSVKKIAQFLGLSPSDAFIQQVVDKTSFASMAKARTSGHVMYRKGIVGDWKNKFTVAQSEKFNEKFEAEMKGTEAYKLYSHTVSDRWDANMNDA